MILTFLIIGCGKVTQVIKEDPPIQSFYLTTSIPLNNSKQATSNTFSSPFYTDTPSIFLVVNGIKEDGKTSILSWGKGELSLVTYNMQTNTAVTPSLKVSTFRRDGIMLEGPSQYMWSKFSTPSPLPNKLNVNSKDIKHQYAFYQVIAFSNSETYLMSLIDGNHVSKNKTVTTPTLSAYNTFINSLYWRHLSSNKYIPNKGVNTVALSSFYSKEFYARMNHRLTRNAIKSFNVKNPVFSISDQRIDILLELFDLYTNKKKQPFNSYLKTIEFLTPQAKDHLERP